MEVAHYYSLLQNFDEALQVYNSFLHVNSNDYEALVGRSVVYHNLGRFEEAIVDAERAMLQDRKRYDAYLRRGLSNLSLGKVPAALIDLEDASQKISGDTKTYILSQVAKARAELNNKSFSEVPPRKSQPQPVTQPVTQPVSQPAPQPQPTQFQQSQQPQPVRENKFAPQPVSNPEAKRTNNISATGKVNYKWYQTDAKVGIEIMQVLQDQTKLKTNFQPKHVEVSFPLQNGSQFELSIDLQHEIVPEQSKTKVMQNEIEILLVKKVSNHNWTRLEADDSVVDAPPIPQQASYPSSAKIKKDWSKIDREIELDIEKNKEEYGYDPLNGLFRQIYEQGSDETKKAMIKSMQTSGGTVLSTNWDEVKNKEYDGKDRPSPPKGQERKKLG